MINPGTLFVVATPIGNLGDFSQRAGEVLSNVDVIAAEDTRHTRKLLNQLKIETPLISYHDYSNASKASNLLRRIKRGQSVALVSDAGTPLISDPGYRLVRRARESGVTVTPIPGASALIAALSVAGLPTDSFVFEGFLPAKASARNKRLKELAFEPRTLVFYESPHRVVKTTAALEEDSDQQKGEFVIVVNGCQLDQFDKHEEKKALDLIEILRKDLSLNRAVSIASNIFNARKNKLYQLALNGEAEE